MKALLRTDNTNVSYFVTRAVLALVILPHGLQKLFGLFGGYGFNGTMQYFTETVGMPWVLGFMIILAETFGMLFLLAGILTRLASGGLIIIMIGAAAQHYQNGFFMNFLGNQRGEGVEYFILVITMAILVTVHGAGKWSVDRWLATDSAGKNSSAFDPESETTA